jgi:hypothetical protein
MPTTAPDWTALASQNEKLVDGQRAEEPGDPAPVSDGSDGSAVRCGRHRAAGWPDAGPRWRIRGSHAAAAVTAVALALTSGRTHAARTDGSRVVAVIL